MTVSYYIFLICRTFHLGTPRAQVTSLQQNDPDLLASWAGGSNDEEGGGIIGQNLGGSNGDFSGGGRGQDRHRSDGRRRRIEKRLKEKRKHG